MLKLVGVIAVTTSAAVRLCWGGLVGEVMTCGKGVGVVLAAERESSMPITGSPSPAAVGEPMRVGDPPLGLA